MPPRQSARHGSSAPPPCPTEDLTHGIPRHIRVQARALSHRLQGRAADQGNLCRPGRYGCHRGAAPVSSRGRFPIGGDLHASHWRHPVSAATCRARARRHSCHLVQQPLSAQRLRADHGKGGARPRRLRAPCTREIRLPARDSRRLEWRRIVVDVLSVAGRAPHGHQHSGGRRARSDACQSRTRGCRHAACGAYQPRQDPHRVDGPCNRRRERSARPRPIARSVWSASAQAALHGRLHRALSGRANCTQPAHHGPGRRSARSGPVTRRYQ